MSLLAASKTKIVCTIGPASDTQETIEAMMRQGMDVARLNFSHGDFSSHGRTIELIRQAATKCGKRIAILADLPGPKIRIGDLAEETVDLFVGAPFILSTENITGNREKVSMNFPRLPSVVSPGDTIFLNDGLIELKVEKINGEEVHCIIIAGGELRSRKGLNLPGIDLGIGAFTEHDHTCLAYALAHGVDAISQSFVSEAADMVAVRQAAEAMGYRPFLIAKIERARVCDKIDEVLAVSDGIMVARGDLGVELPIEQIAVTQKFITARANFFSKPVITATQMLESMKASRRPTRAEATDVANAILDGTDCVMLSEESATGFFPVEAVAMLRAIARATEPHRIPKPQNITCSPVVASEDNLADSIAHSVQLIMARVKTTAAILVPTASGTTARSLVRFRLPVWIVAVSPHEATCRGLKFSYGVYPVLELEHPTDWSDHAKEYVKTLSLDGDCIIQTEGPSPAHPIANYKVEIIPL